jgi:hypothetical protein
MNRKAESHSKLWGNPYFFVGPRPFREARIRSYIVREHRHGRALNEIVGDRYLVRYGGANFVAKVVDTPETIAALAADTRVARSGQPF